MRYTVTLTELDDVSGNPDAKVVGVTSHTGEAFEVLAPAVHVRNDPREIRAEIRRETDGATVSFGELVEDARVSATTVEARELWVDAMADLVHGWVHPWDDGAPMFDPPDMYWRDAGRSWANFLGQQPPPDDLVAALDGYPDMCGYGIFVDVARQLTGTTSVATSAVRRAGAALGLTDAAPGIPPLSATPLSSQLTPGEPPQRGQGRGR